MRAPRYSVTLIRHERRVRTGSGNQALAARVSEEELWAVKETTVGGSPDIIDGTEAGQWPDRYKLRAAPTDIIGDGRFTLRDNERNGELFRILDADPQGRDVVVSCESYGLYDPKEPQVTLEGVYGYSAPVGDDDETEQVVIIAGIGGDAAYLRAAPTT